MGYEYFGATWVIIPDCTGKGKDAEAWFKKIEGLVRDRPVEDLNHFIDEELGLSDKMSKEDAVLELTQIIEEFRDVLDEDNENVNKGQEPAMDAGIHRETESEVIE